MCPDTCKGSTPAVPVRRLTRGCSRTDGRVGHPVGSLSRPPLNGYIVGRTSEWNHEGSNSDHRGCLVGWPDLWVHVGWTELHSQPSASRVYRRRRLALVFSIVATSR